MLRELDEFRHTLLQHARNKPGQLALCGDDAQVNYAALIEQVVQREIALHEQGSQPLGLIMDNGTDAVLWDLAALVSGIPCTTLPRFFSAKQRAHCLAQSGVSLVVADDSFGLELSACGFIRESQFWQRVRPAATQLPDGTAKVTYTSGTTGNPKGVCLSAATLLRVARELERASQSTAPQRYLAVLPLAVLLENLGVYAALIAGAAVQLPTQQQLGITGASGVDWQRFLGALMMSGAQSFILVPQLLLGLVTALERGVVNGQQFRFVAVGGARVSADLLRRAAAVGLPVFEGYGLSECASVVCLNRPEGNRPGSVGRPLSHVSVKLAEDGEVLVKGAALLGYLGETPCTGEWWATGDVGEFDADGYLYLKGRKKYQFITSFGRNVNPDWVEAELTQQGVIGQAFVHGEALPHNVALLWPLQADCGDAAIAAAVANANDTLPDYARVHRWQRLPEPFNAANGMLTDNGRLRRDEIISRYRDVISELVSE